MDVGTLQTALDEMKTKATDIAGDVDKLSKSCTDSCNSLGTMGGIFGGEIKKFAATVEKGVGDALKTFGNISAAAGKAVGQITDIVKQLFSKIGSLTATAISKITVAIDSVKEIFDKIKTEVGAKVVALQTQVSGMVTSLKNIVAPSDGAGTLAVNCENNMSAIKSIEAGASAVVDKIKSAASSAAETVKSIGTNVAGGISSAVSGVTSSVTSATSSLGATITQPLPGIPGVVSAVSGAATSTASSLTSSLPSISALTGNAAQAVSNALKGGEATSSINSVNSALADTTAEIANAGSLMKNVMEQNLKELQGVAGKLGIRIPNSTNSIFDDSPKAAVLGI